MYPLSGHDCTDHRCAGWILCESNCFSPCPRRPAGQISPRLLFCHAPSSRAPVLFESRPPSSSFFIFIRITDCSERNSIKFLVSAIRREEIERSVSKFRTTLNSSKRELKIYKVYKSVLINHDILNIT